MTWSLGSRLSGWILVECLLWCQSLIRAWSYLSWGVLLAHQRELGRWPCTEPSLPRTLAWRTLVHFNIVFRAQPIHSSHKHSHLHMNWFEAKLVAWSTELCQLCPLSFRTTHTIGILSTLSSRSAWHAIWKDLRIQGKLRRLKTLTYPGFPSIRTSLGTVENCCF